MLSQVRKFALVVFIAKQLLDQFEPDIRDAVLSSVGTLIVFRVGLPDVRMMEREFYPEFTYDDFLTLPKYYVYVKPLIDGTKSKGFSAVMVERFFDK